MFPLIRIKESPPPIETGLEEPSLNANETEACVLLKWVRNERVGLLIISVV